MFSRCWKLQDAEKGKPLLISADLQGNSGHSHTCVGDIASLVRWVVASKWLQQHIAIYTTGHACNRVKNSCAVLCWSGQIQHEFTTKNKWNTDVAFTSEISFFRRIIYIHIVLVLVLFSSWGHPANPSTGTIDGMVTACFSLKLCTQENQGSLEISSFSDAPM